MTKLGAHEGGPRAGAAGPNLGPQAQPVSFKVLAEISVGATARIDLCRAEGPNRPGMNGQLLAVKRLHPHIAEDPAVATEFLDEVWMTASLKHPNVVEVRGWGNDAQGAYLCVELVQGVSLARLMKTVFETGEVFGERMVVFIASRLCRGLDAAHALRAPNGELLHLVHRDLTPANVLVGFQGDVKIADFGMAKAKQRLTKTLTGMRKGEPQYMAPEQAQTDDIDGRADLFSLGVMLFELFTGRKPWVAKNEFEMVQVITRDPPADLRELRPKIDKELVAIVNKCLEKDRQSRFQSAREIGERLENWLVVHGYQEGNEEALGRFVRRNGMRQMNWFERAIGGELTQKPRIGRALPPRVPTYTDHTGRPVQGSPRDKDKPPSLADENEATDAEWRMRQIQPSDPIIVAKDQDEEEDEGEEGPTLVQKGSASLNALRAAQAKLPKKPGPPRPDPRLIVDEDSDQRITAVKGDKRPAAQARPDADGEEDLPTEPVRNRPAAGRRAIDAARPPSRSEPTRPGAIPAAPGVPLYAGAAAQPPPAPPAPPSSATGASAAGGSRFPPPAAPPQPVPMEVKARTTGSDDVQVIERADMTAALSEEALIAEADRLAIEAVRRTEEARAAAQRAERKAAMAKLASDAAIIASDAVRLIGAAGLAAARARLTEAHKLEHAMQRSPAEASGKVPVFEGPVSTPPVSAQPASAPWAPPPSNPSNGPSPAGVPPPPPPRPSQFPQSYEGNPGSLPLPPHVSRPPFASPGSMAPPPAIPAPAPLPADLVTSGTYDDDKFRAQLKPTLLGLPPVAIAALGIVAFCLAFLILWFVFS
ncbi:MAG: protein kinase [Byssovorax sp.]